jgi:RHS repeat-associated protein
MAMARRTAFDSTTRYERDNETGLDYAHARYYGNVQGRFTSADPFAGSATVANPQTFNRYAYVGNNPVNMNDPTGMQGTFPEYMDMNSAHGITYNNWGGGYSSGSAIPSWSSGYDHEYVVVDKEQQEQQSQQQASLPVGVTDVDAELRKLKIPDLPGPASATPSALSDAEIAALGPPPLPQGTLTYHR